MATGGVDYSDPEVQKGFELFDTLFHDRLHPPERSEERPEEGPEQASPHGYEVDYSDPEVQKGFELFDTLFHDRLHPPESPEESPEQDPQLVPEDEPPEQEPPPPIQSPARPPPRRPNQKTPPEWLVRDTDHDFVQPRNPDWFARFFDPEYKSSPPPRRRRQPSPDSPEYWSPALEGDLTDEVFLPNIPPEPEPRREPPIPEAHFDSSFDHDMHRMQHELVRYHYDKRYIREFVINLPLLRNFDILQKDLKRLYNMYIPIDLVADEQTDPMISCGYLRQYIQDTERQIDENRGPMDPFKFDFPRIPEEIQAAEMRLTKQKAIRAIDNYKRAILLTKVEIKKAQVETENLVKNYEIWWGENKVLIKELDRFREEEEKLMKEYEDTLYEVHHTKCPYLPQLQQARRRAEELKKLIPQLKTELENAKENHEEHVTNLSSWASLFPPKFLKRLMETIYNRLKKDRYIPIPIEEYMDLSEGLEKDLQDMKKKREVLLRKEQKQVQKTLGLGEEMSEITGTLSKAVKKEQREIKKLIAELERTKYESQRHSDAVDKLLEEQIHQMTYNEMLSGRLVSFEVSATPQSDVSSSRVNEGSRRPDHTVNTPEERSRGSRSPSPVGNPPEERSRASPPAFGSEGFNTTYTIKENNTTQREISPSDSESPRIVDDVRTPPEMMNISGLSESGNSAESDGSQRFESALAAIDGEQSPSEMVNMSDESQGGSSGSPQDWAEYGLDEEPRPSEMMNISGLSQEGSSGSPRGSPQDWAEYGLDEEPQPSEMLNISDLSGSGSFEDSLDDSRSPNDSLERSAISVKKTISIPSPRRNEQLKLDVEIIPKGIRQSPSGRRVTCDVAVEMQEAALRPQRRIERRNIVVRGTPPISQTVGRRFDRKYGMFTPQSAFKRRHISLRKPLFEGDYESPPSPWGTGRKTHPEFLDMTPYAPSPRPPKLNTTIEWEKNP